MARRIEIIFIPGPAGRLESLLEEPEDGEPIQASLVCHPHPQHGGTMHNKVVYRAARGLRQSGSVVLRFNYRGVNLSEGVYAHGEGELDDARVALDLLLTRYPNLPLTIAGFSFGSKGKALDRDALPPLERLFWLCAYVVRFGGHAAGEPAGPVRAAIVRSSSSSAPAKK